MTPTTPESAAPRTFRLARIAAVALPALLALVIGLTHPVALTASTAEWWRDLHLVLLPVFPLIGAAPWLAARAAATPWRAVAELGGFVFAVFYDGLDVLAGIGAGSVQLAGHPEAKAALYAIASVLGPIGCVGLAVGWLGATVGLLRSRGPWALVGVLGIGAAALIQRSHVYFPVGTVGLIALIVAGVVLVLLSGRSVGR